MPEFSKLVQPAQISLPFLGYVQASGLAYPAAATLDVSTILSTMAGTAGFNRSTAAGGTVAVPHQAMSTTQMGWAVTAPDNRIEVWNDTTGAKITSLENNEVYGRLTASGAVYSLLLFQSISGVETAYTPAAPVTIRAAFLYLFDSHVLPLNAFTVLGSTNVSQDAAAGARPNFEPLVITANNTVPNLTYAPLPGTTILYVNGKPEHAIGALPSITVAGNAVTWSETNAKYPLLTTMTCVAAYFY